MKLWMTSEAMADVADALRVVRNSAEEEMNRFLADTAFPQDFKEWAVIVIVLPKDLEPSFPEVVRKSGKRKVLEFRLQIPHQEFLIASDAERLGMLFDCLSRSIDLMPKLSVSAEGQAVAREALAKARQSLSV
jgi:hypothetical protein